MAEPMRPLITPLHVCLIAPDIWPVIADDRKIDSVGGAEVQQSFIARGLRDKGYRVTIVTNVSGWSDEFEMDGLRIVRLIRRGPEIPIIRNIHPRLTSVWNALLRADADVYFQRCASANTLVAGLFCRRYGRGFIYSGASDLDFQRDQNRKHFMGRGARRERQMFQWGLKLADGIVAQHRGQVEACRHWYGREAVEIPNFYVLPPRGGGGNRDSVILWVATVKSLKRPELFLELVRRCPHLTFCMVGGAAPGNEASVFTQIKEMAKLLPNLDFVGFRPFLEVEAYFDKARVFVNTSEYEGFPNTFLQSWARGIPTVSFFDCRAKEGGRPVGFVCHSLDEMAETIARLVKNDDLWDQERKRAQRYFEANHSAEVALTKYSQLFEQVLSARSRISCRFDPH